MDGDLYDEFGNYIGPELSGSEQVRQPTMQHLAPRSWGAACAIPSCMSYWCIAHTTGG